MVPSQNIVKAMIGGEEHANMYNNLLFSKKFNTKYKSKRAISGNNGTRVGYKEKRRKISARTTTNIE
jgi:hypothetical protein